MQWKRNSRDCRSLKLPESRAKELEAMGLWDMSIEEFDDIDEEHDFSERYKRKKRRMMTGLRQIEEQRQQEQENISGAGGTKGWLYRTAALVLVVILIVPATVYAATKLYQLNVTRKEHEAQVSIELSNDSAEPVTAEETHILREDGITVIADRSPMKVTLSYVPEQCIYYEDYKYDGADQKGTYGISMFMLLGDFSDSWVENVPYSIASEKREVNGREYAVVTKDETFIYNKEVYVPLQEWNTVLLMYVGEGISMEELDKIVAGVKVEETANMAEAIPSADITDSFFFPKETGTRQDMYDIAIPKDCMAYGVGDTVRQGALDITVNHVELFTSIEDFDMGNFYTDMLYEHVKDGDISSGYNRALMVQGDGINTVNKYTEKMKMRQKFVYITLTLKTGNVAVSEYYINNLQRQFIKINEVGDYVCDSRGNALMNLDTKVIANAHGLVYFDHSIEGNQSTGFFNMGEIPANSEVTVHVGFLVDEDMLDGMYLQVPRSRYGDTSDGETNSYYIKLVE